MTVTRRVTITYDAADERTAKEFEDWLGQLVMGPYYVVRVTGQAFSSEPVIPSPEPLVEPGGD